MPKLLLILITTIILTGCKPNLPKPGSMQTSLPTSSQSQVNYQASFAIFTNGVFRVFTAPMYHNLSPEVYIEAKNPNIIQVKKAGITWNDFFKTLPMALSRECLTTGTKEQFCNSSTQTLKFYINGQKVADFLNRQINAGDKALISFGSETENQIQEQLKRIPQLDQ